MRLSCVCSVVALLTASMSVHCQNVNIHDLVNDRCNLTKYSSYVKLSGQEFYLSFKFNEMEVTMPPSTCADRQEFDLAKCGCVARDNPDSGTTPVEEAKCKVLEDLKFDPQLNKFMHHGYIEMGNDKRNVDLTNFTVPSPTQRDRNFEKVLRFNGKYLRQSRFRGNQLNGDWQSKLRVLPDPNQFRPMVLLTDDCDEKEEERASIKLELIGNELQVMLRTTNETVNDKCSTGSTEYGWHQIDMSSKTNEGIGITVDGIPCVFLPNATLATTQCALYLGASPKDNSTAFYGFLSQFTFYKNPEAKKKCDEQ